MLLMNDLINLGMAHIEIFKEITCFYRSDLKVDELTTQLSIFTTKFASQQQTSKRATLRDIFKFMQSLTGGQRTFFSEVCNVI